MNVNLAIALTDIEGNKIKNEKGKFDQKKNYTKKIFWKFLTGSMFN